MTRRNENSGLAQSGRREPVSISAPLEIEESFIACVETLQRSLQLNSLTRELHHQIILDDEVIEPVRFFLHGRTGLPLATLQQLKRVRLRESRLMTASGSEQTLLELTAKSAKRHDRRGRKIVRDEVTVPLTAPEFDAWSSHGTVVGKLTKLRLRLPNGGIRKTATRLEAEIDYLLDAGPDAARAPLQVLHRRSLPASVLKVCLVDCEYPCESAVSRNSLRQWPELWSSALPAAGEEHPQLKFLRKGYLAKHGITPEALKAQMFALSLIRSRAAQ